jgi:hypothetical protein
MAKGRKIKRVKSLYKPRKSQSRKILEIAAMVVVVCGLGFVGWSIGSAILNYTPPDGQFVLDNEELTVPADTEPSDDPEPYEPYEPPVDDAPINAIAAPSSVLDNPTSLAAYIRQAELNGFNAVVLEMKDSAGHLFFASEFEPVQDTDIIRGTLTAAQIFAAFEDTGVRPVVRLNTLLDRLAPGTVPDVSYVFASGGGRWLDDTIENGGKLWANPFLQGTRDYHLFIIEELVNAGFTDIVLANIIFPLFRNSDRNLLAPEFTVPATRFEGLAGFAKALETSSANLYLEMTVSDVIENAGTAEVLRGSRELNNFELLLVYNMNDFPHEHETAGDIGALAAAMYRQAMNQVQNNGFIITPFLNREGLTDREIADILGVFGDLGFEGFVIR